MLRIVRFLAFAILFVAIAIPASVVGWVWWEGARLFSKVEAAGRFDPLPPDTPITTFESVIARGVFGDTWDEAGFPCPTVARTWNATWRIMTDKPVRRGSGMALSQFLARDITPPEYPSYSIRGHVGRLSLACQLERRHSELTNLRLFLRQAYFGGRSGEVDGGGPVYGAETASQMLFQKPTGELNEWESIRLAALLDQPSGLSHPDILDRAIQYMTKRIHPN